MYDYRRWTPEQRAASIASRKQRVVPLHSPPHFDAPEQYRIITGTCFEHREILNTDERLAWFESELLDALDEMNAPCTAWVVLPNHYHVLAFIRDIKAFTKALGQLHGRTSYEMNKADKKQGRQVWFRSQDRCMRSEAHYYTTINYIHNNPVKHGYVTKWTDWPYSSVHEYLATKGREWLVEAWRRYPVLNYGDKWDV